MKILLLGDFSNVHWELGNALRKLGHDVKVVSNGNYWRGYLSDVSLKRGGTSLKKTLIYICKLLWQMLQWRGYDIVQVIHPVYFLELKPKRVKFIYDYLRRHNKRVYMGAMGDDYQYVFDSYERRKLRYCDYYTPDREIDNERNKQTVYDWLHTYKKDLCLHVANTCDGIITVLYEYDVAYREDYPNKTFYVPLPIQINDAIEKEIPNVISYPIRILVGMERGRDEMKGRELLYNVVKKIEKKYPDKCEVVATESLPYYEYIERMAQCDVLLDQIYSYTPGMNALQAMSMGLVVVSGGEEEHYELVGEKELRPIINVQPDEEDIYNKLEQLILHPERILQLKHEGIDYVRHHHDSLKVAERYLDAWKRPTPN